MYFQLNNSAKNFFIKIFSTLRKFSNNFCRPWTLFLSMFPNGSVNHRLGPLMPANVVQKYVHCWETSLMYIAAYKSIHVQGSPRGIMSLWGRVCLHMHICMYVCTYILIIMASTMGSTSGMVVISNKLYYFL